ncbi:uncharacterized protein LOC111810620 [Cucurbita pepo subsp. pepo]|uniref:uncharacterized protein LOC111810620 n=1 Tax=Cucurbita pepo subsp. pepo TaxID=3664 RepID=UPI000C9D635F|nr:uncharacterized protein LOC111810620 [Cucurbita pepo subsp. pepo]
MGKSESARECKRHQNHNQLPGICPSCLRERLQQLQQSSISYSDSRSTSSSSFLKSSESFFSGNTSWRRRHTRNASELVTGSMAADLFGDKVKKSSSIRISADGGGGGGGGKKKVGFWSRFLVRPKALYFHSHPKVSSREILG